MKKITRMFGTTALLTGLALGGAALSAGAASADTGSNYQMASNSSPSREGEENNYGSVSTSNSRAFELIYIKYSEHSSTNGYWDSEHRFHNKYDNSGWRDDDNNWRADWDHNGKWCGEDGREHDQNSNDDERNRDEHEHGEGNHKNTHDDEKTSYDHQSSDEHEHSYS